MRAGASRRYWNTTATTNVLSDCNAGRKYGDGDGGLEQVAYDITYGDASEVMTYAHQEVSAAEMRALLIEQGSDPSFLLAEDDDESGD